LLGYKVDVFIIWTYLLFVEAHLKHAGVAVDKMKPDATAWYYIEREKALQFQIE